MRFMDELWRKKKIVVKIQQLRHDLELGVQGSNAAVVDSAVDNSYSCVDKSISTHTESNVTFNASNGVNPFPFIVQGIVADLRSLIDRIDLNFKQARELVLEIAKRLDESRVCRRDEICRRLKDILEDKIREGKITAKWIEECIPQEYKRRYIKNNKSELSSLSNQSRKEPLAEQVSSDLVLVGAQVEKALTNRNKENKSKYSDNTRIEQIDNKKERDNFSDYSLGSRGEGLLQQKIELEEVVQRQTLLQTADQIPATEIKLIIPKEKFQELLTAIQRSKALCYLTFDKSRAFLRADPDIFVGN